MTVYSIYKIHKKSLAENAEVKTYIGHTKNFLVRRRVHKHSCNHGVDYSLYKHIRDNGGWDEWEMTELFQVECETEQAARVHEQKAIEEYGGNLNTYKAFLSEEDSKEYRRIKSKEWNKAHVEQCKEYLKNWRESHKDYQSKWRENHPESHKDYQIKWRENHPDYYKEYRLKLKQNKQD